MPTQNFLRLLLLLMLVTRIVLATICGRFGSWGLVKKLNFCSDFEHKVWSRFRSWSKGEIWSWSLVSFFCWCFVEVIWILVEILKLGLANIFKFNFSRDVWDFEVDTCSRFWSMKFDQDLCATCDMNSTLGSVVPLAMFSISRWCADGGNLLYCDSDSCPQVKFTFSIASNLRQSQYFP